MSKIDHPQRFHDLDALRAFAMMLGILYHLSLSFGEFFGHYEPVLDRSAHHLFDIFALASHGFRMPLFFLIAGFFSHLVLTRKGTSYFVSNRFKRIFVPLVLAFLLIIPLIRFLKHYAKSGHYEGFSAAQWLPQTHQHDGRHDQPLMIAGDHIVRDYF